MTLLDAITQSKPDELYNLAATSFVPASWRQPVMTAQFTAVGVTSMLEAVRITNPGLRVYQASTSEIFGATTESLNVVRTGVVHASSDRRTSSLETVRVLPASRSASLSCAIRPSSASTSAS